MTHDLDLSDTKRDIVKNLKNNVSIDKIVIKDMYVVVICLNSVV